MANATRSQMAEAWAKAIKSDVIDAYSAGVRPLGRVSSRATRAMAEVGVDMTNHWSKGIEDWPGLTFDYVITLCDHAREYCPSFPPETKMVHHNVPDPTGIIGPTEQVMVAFRNVREMLRVYVQSLPEALESQS